MLLKQVEFGDYLLELRESKGLSLAQLGDKVGVSSNHLSEIERARKQPSDSLIRALAKFYEKDEDEFFSRLGRVPALATEYLEHSEWLQKTLSELSNNRRISDEERDELESELYAVYKKFLERKR